jgi:hypothetical protein
MKFMSLHPIKDPPKYVHAIYVCVCKVTFFLHEDHLKFRMHFSSAT